METTTTKTNNNRNQEFLHKQRKKFVNYATKNGIHAAAHHFKVSRNTIRLWLRRYQENPSQPLYDRPPERYHPHAMSQEYREKLLATVSQIQLLKLRVIVNHIRKACEIPFSLNTVLQFLKRKGFIPSKYRKQQAKLTILTDKKQLMKFCELIQVDIKYLTDIPELQYSIAHNSVPKYQITARDVATGTLWISFTREKSVTNTAIFIHYLGAHLKSCGVDLSQVIFQTDNGTEFVPPAHSFTPTLFQKSINSLGAHHRTIPPASPTYNSDVVLSTMEHCTKACVPQKQTARSAFSSFN